MTECDLPVIARSLARSLCTVCPAVLQHLCGGLPEAGGGLPGRRRPQQQLLRREGETSRVQELRLGALPTVELQRLGGGEAAANSDHFFYMLLNLLATEMHLSVQVLSRFVFALPQFWTKVGGFPVKHCHIHCNSSSGGCC